MTIELSNASSFRIASGVVAHTLWTSVAPSMIYPLYAQEWNLTPTVTTVIFASYQGSVVVILLMLGNLSDRVGVRLPMLWGVSASAVGVLLFALANNVGLLMLGRVLMGIGVGLSAAPATTALVRYATSNGVSKASSATITAQSFGFAAALLVGGVLAQYAPYPTRLCFYLLFGLLLLLLAPLFFLPRDRRARSDRRGRPSFSDMRRDVGAPFVLAATTVTTAYIHGVLFTSLGAQIARDLVRSQNIFVNSLTLACFALALGLVGFLARRTSPTLAILLGTLSSIVGVALLVTAAVRHSLIYFLSASAASGGGYALLVYGGLVVINASAPAAVRGKLTSAVLLVAYIVTGLLAVTLGKIATIFDMMTATRVGVLVMLTFCGGVLLLLGRRRDICMQSRA